MRPLRVVPITAGAIALLSTTALLVIHIVISTQVANDGTLPTTAIAAAALEGLALVAVALIYTSYFTPSSHLRSQLRFYCQIGAGVVCCIAAAAPSIVTIVNLGQPRTRTSGSDMQPDQFMTVSAVVFGISFACQAVFLATHFVIARNPFGVPSGGDLADDSRPDEEKRRPIALTHVKSIPYSTTTAQAPRSVRSLSFGTSGSTIGGRSRSNTINSAHSFVSHSIRPASGKSKPPLPQNGDRGIRRAISLDSTLRPNLLRPEDAFADSWDSSSVSIDGLKLDVSPSLRPSLRFLETIPASPIVSSRTPSPSQQQHPLYSGKLEVPRVVRRSRSCSPMSSRGSLCASPEPAFVTMHDNTSEAHIHPLFRSDSPVPPPAATPGTVVVASPDAGRILSSRHSIQSLQRMRSGSFSPGPSLLNRQTTFEDFAVATQRYQRSRASSDARSSRSDMIPSIAEPDMSGAGSRTSMLGYNARRSNSLDEDL